MGLSQSRQRHHEDLNLIQDGTNQDVGEGAANAPATTNEGLFNSTFLDILANSAHQTPVESLSSREAYLFWINRIIGSAPRFAKTKPIPSSVSINKSSIRLKRRIDAPSIYDVEFTFDAATNCVISVLYCAEEIKKNNYLQYVGLSTEKLLSTPGYEEALEEGPNKLRRDRNLIECTPDVVRASFPPQLHQSFSTSGRLGLDTSIYPASALCPEGEKPSNVECREGGSLELPCDDRSTNPDVTTSLGPVESSSQTLRAVSGDSTHSPGLDQTNDTHKSESGRKIIPIVIIIEPVGKETDVLDPRKSRKLFKDATSSLIVQLALYQTKMDYVCHITQQKVIVNGITYNVYDIYGIEQNLYCTEEMVLDSTYRGPDECVICLSERRNTLVLPCRHVCLCEECARLITYQSMKCPICRGPLQLLLNVDFEDPVNNALRHDSDK